VSDVDFNSATFGTQTDLTNEGYGSKRPSGGHVYKRNVQANALGRWPANVIHDGSDEVVAIFPDSKGQLGVATQNMQVSKNRIYGKNSNYTTNPEPRNDSGSAARFFYCAKASRSERDLGCENIHNSHPTVKPVAVMRWLVKLVTPIGGTVVDPFCGSGTTGIGAKLEGMDAICIDFEQDSIDIAEARILAWNPEPINTQISLF
jgi:site-specific DNA-methyltransferase (adenine-specific)